MAWAVPPFMYTVDNPETNGLTEGELFGYAALKAMEDASVIPQDVDFYPPLSCACGRDLRRD